MTSLDAHVWQTRFTDLRTPVLSAFPRLHRQDVEAAGDDFDALVHLIQRHSGLSASEVHERLSEIEVTDHGAEDGGRGSDEAGRRRASISQLRIAFGFEESERARILELLAKLDRQLQRFPADGVDLELAVKDRDTTAQKLTLAARLPNVGTVIATSREHSLRDALMDCREDLWRQINEQLDRRRR
jgi:ribosome-associated translation inhibitor RaiA